MPKDHFIHLFKYNYWATRKTAESLVELKNKNDKSEKLLSHIISAQKIWLNRILKRDIIINPWQKITSDEWIEQNTTVTSEWINLIESFQEKDFDARVKYKNIAGEKYTNTVKDIITHVINHSTYHRAQIALLIRQSGGEPAKTDYIVYQRMLQK
jgi:uncharacterized damage-inducible protein DinB